MASRCKMVIFSDLHYAPEEQLESEKVENKLIKYALPILEKLTNNINNEIKPDIVINLGDLIKNFNQYDKDINNMKFILNKLNKINFPVYSVVGNHDYRSFTSIKELEELLGYENSTFSIDINGYHLIFLGIGKSKKIKNIDGKMISTQFLLEEDIQWLKEDLEENELPVLVFVHYGVAEDDMEDNEWFKYYPGAAALGNRDVLKKILNNNPNVLAVFSGHQHRTKLIVEDGINYYVIGSLTERTKQEGVPDGVYFEIELEGKKLNVEEKHIRLNEI